MKNQIKRIEDFLKRNIDETLPAEQHVQVFSQEEDVGAGGQTNITCVNKTVACKGSKNGSCSNYDDNCTGATNDALCDKGFDKDFDIYSCGNGGDAIRKH